MQAHLRPTAVAYLAAVLVLGGFVAQGLVIARTDTPTADEFVYVPQGYYYLRQGDLSFDPTNPPLLKSVMALPLLAMDLQLDGDPRWRADPLWGGWIFATRFMDLNRARYLDAFFVARAVILSIGVALGILVFARARALLSPTAALAVLILFATMPPLIAHSSLATLDVGVTTLLFAAFAAFERFAVRRAWPWAGLGGVLLGVALVTKWVSALFFPLVPVLVALRWRAWTRAGFGRLAAGAAAAVAGAWLAVEATYGFSGLPVPAPVIAGVRFQAEASSLGEFPAFLNGRWSATGWWYYYLVALGLKTPIPTLLLAGLGTVAVLGRWRRDDRVPWIVVPPLFLLYVLSFHYGKNYGIRYLLPAFPFLLLLAGHGVEALLRRGARGAAAAAVLLSWQILACAVAAPHHLAYFNELAGGPDESRHLLLDSNLDWGQDLGRFKEYVDEHAWEHVCLAYWGHVDPHLYGIDYSFPPTAPAPVRCALSANFLGGSSYGITYAGEGVVNVPPGAWSWFDRHRPVARVGRSIFIFDVGPDLADTAGSAATPREVQ